MGVLVADEVKVPGIGITISNFTITCRGSYEVTKSINYTPDNGPMYFIRTVVHWYVAGGEQPIYQDTYRLQFEVLPADIFVAIYDSIKAGYQNVTDV
jgi:hypothetical protein